MDGAGQHAARCACHDQPEIGWVIAGGESGPNARPMHPDWARNLRDQCEQVGVSFLFKQWGEWVPVGPDEETGRDSAYLDRAGSGTFYSHRYHSGVQQMARVGKKRAGRELDGRTWDEFPSAVAS
jgi:protein gp37